MIIDHCVFCLLLLVCTSHMKQTRTAYSFVAAPCNHPWHVHPQPGWSLIRYSRNTCISINGLGGWFGARRFRFRKDPRKWKGLLLGGTPRIPNHQAPNHQVTITISRVSKYKLWHLTPIASWQLVATMEHSLQNPSWSIRILRFMFTTKNTSYFPWYWLVLIGIPIIGTP